MPTFLTRRMSVTTALILSNVLIFLLGSFFSTPAIFGIPYPGAPEHEPVTFVRGAYSWFNCFMEGELWRLITYQFLHAGLPHLIFNMWALFFFGPLVENAMGSGRYLAFYLSCGVAGALFSSLLAALGFFDTATPPELDIFLRHLAHYTGHESLQLWQLTSMVGASAAIYGVLVAVAFLYPGMRIRLVIPPVEMTMRTFALVVLGLAVLTVTLNAHNAGGEAGHLGGIILAAIIMSVWRFLYIRRRNHDGTF